MRRLASALALAAIILACGESSKAEVDPSKIGGECFVLNGESNCAEGEQCVTFPTLKQPHCAKDPCSAIRCPSGSFCAFVVSLPAAVGCF